MTGELDDEGLGFDYKWNMGWMNDFTEYMKNDPVYRGGTSRSADFFYGICILGEIHAESVAR